MRFSSVSIAGEDAFHDPGGRSAFDQRQAEDFSSPTFHFALADDVVSPVRAFDENVGMDGQDGLKRGVVLKPSDEVHHLETIQKFRAFMLGNDRPARAFYADDRAVAVDGNDEGIAHCAAPAQKIDVAGVQDIEASIRKNNAFTGRLKLLNARGDLV